MIKVNDELMVTYENAIFYENKLWFTDINCGDFFSYDLELKKTELICQLAYEENYKDRLFSAIVPCGIYMYLIPFSAKNIYKINLEGKNSRKISFNIPNAEGFPYYEDSAKWISAHLCHDKIFLMPATYPGIMEIDCETEAIVYYDSWITDAKKGYLVSENAFFRKTLLLDKYIYAPLCGKNAVVKFDTENKHTDIIQVGSEDCTYSGICHDGERFWLSPRQNGPIVQWNEKKNIWKEYNNFYQRGGYNDIICIGDDIFLIPGSAEKLLKVNRNSEKCVVVDCDDSISNHMCQCVVRNYIYFFSAYNAYLYIYDLSSNRVIKEQLQLSENIKKQYKKYLSMSYQIFTQKRKRENELLWENYQGALKDYIDYVKKVDELKATVVLSCGKIIAEQMKDFLNI